MPSREFNILKRNVNNLEKQFLNFSKRTDGKYTKSELTLCRAFIAFVHAEIEHFLESLAFKTLNRAETNWDEKEKATIVVAGLLAYLQTEQRSLPENPREQRNDNRLKSLIKKSFKTQHANIRANHGVKPINISKLFLPLGLAPDLIEEALTIQLSNFGERRGDLVHSSYEVSLPKIRDPFDDELKDVHFLLDELESFDETVNSLR